MTYPFGELPDNLAAFCDVLRRERSFRVGPAEIRDAARALEVVDIANERCVRDALRAVLAGSRDEAAAFDEAFRQFFFPFPGVAQERLTPPSAPEGERARRRRLGHEPGGLEPGEAGTAGEHEASEAESTDEDAADDSLPRLARARYSPLAGQGRTSISLPPVDPAWRDAARGLVRHLQLGLSRRWRPGHHGKRFDLRRSWRASLQTGGEVLSPRWLRRRTRRARLVLLIDGSRSMSDIGRPALSLAVALAAVTTRVEVCTFSTTLCTVTSEVRRVAAGHPGSLEIDRDAWGGGTNIGASIHTFLQRLDTRTIGRDTLVIVVSDGLDVGEPAQLAAGMRELLRRSAGILWLNPLLDSPGYAPTSRGMAAARPFVTTFASADSAAAFARVSRRIRIRAR